MNLARMFWLLLAIFVAAPASAATTLSRVQVHGRDYVRLSDWAKAYSFKLTWTRREEALEVSSRWSKISFAMDSRRAEFNGTVIWLSFPIAYREGQAYIAPLDLEKTIHPILFPPRSTEKQRITTICLDPGHGGRDPGKQDGRNQEKEYTLLLAQELQRQLKGAGFKVVMTRTSDKTVDLPMRSLIAKNLDSDLFVSLHFNAADSNASGIEVFSLTPPGASSTGGGGDSASAVAYPGNRTDERNMLLGYHVQKSMSKSLFAEDRGAKRARFAVLKYTDTPAILIEGGFMTNRSEATKIYNSGYRRQMAKAITDGILAYRQTVERK
jgi:N-acetylmuramoyl-L-alanine amidase